MPTNPPQRPLHGRVIDNPLIQAYLDFGNQIRYGMSEADRVRLISSGGIPGAPGGLDPAGQERFGSSFLAGKRFGPGMEHIIPAANSVRGLIADIPGNPFNVGDETGLDTLAREGALAGVNAGIEERLGITLPEPPVPRLFRPPSDGLPTAALGLTSPNQQRSGGGGALDPAADFGRIFDAEQGRFETYVDVEGQGTLNFDETNHLRATLGLPPLTPQQFKDTGGGSSTGSNSGGGGPSASQRAAREANMGETDFDRSAARDNHFNRVIAEIFGDEIGPVKVGAAGATQQAARAARLDERAARQAAQAAAGQPVTATGHSPGQGPVAAARPSAGSNALRPVTPGPAPAPRSTPSAPDGRSPVRLTPISPVKTTPTPAGPRQIPTSPLGPGEPSPPRELQTGAPTARRAFDPDRFFDLDR